MIKELKDCLIKKIRQDYSDNASEIDKKIRKIEEAKNIRDLGITMQKAIEILKQNGMPIILTEEDKRIFQNFSEKLFIISQKYCKIKRILFRQEAAA